MKAEVSSIVLKKSLVQFVWPFLLLLVLASNYTLYHSSLGISLMPENTKGIVIGSLIDLTIVVPTLYLVWKRKLNWKYLIVLMGGGLIVARFMIPMEYLAPFQALTWVGFGIEGTLVLLELLLIISLFKFLPKIIKSVGKSSLPLLFSFSNAVEEKVKDHPLIQIICSEMLMFYYAFGMWKKKPQSKENTFTLDKNSSLIAFQVMLIHAIVIETIGIHWWLHDKSMILSLILLILNIYSVILFLGDIQAVRFNPLQVEHDRMYVSLGLMKRMEIRWDDIAEVIEEREKLEQKLSNNKLILLRGILRRSIQLFY